MPLTQSGSDSAAAAVRLQLKGIDHFEKWEAAEIAVSGADSCDPVLAHKNCRVRVVEQISGKVWELCNDLSGYVSAASPRSLSW